MTIAFSGSILPRSAGLIRCGEEPCLINIKQSKDQLVIEQLAGSNVPEEVIRTYVTNWFDLNRELEPFYHLLDSSSLAYMANEFNGLRLVRIPDLFEALCWCVIGQQINLTFAYKIKRRFVEAYGSKLEYGDYLYYTFPSPDDLAGVNF